MNIQLDIYVDNASSPRGYCVQCRHGGEWELHRQEDGDNHDEHHGGAVCVPLSPVPGLLVAGLDPEYREAPGDETVVRCCFECHIILVWYPRKI